MILSLTDTFSRVLRIGRVLDSSEPREAALLMAANYKGLNRGRGGGGRGGGQGFTRGRGFGHRGGGRQPHGGLPGEHASIVENQVMFSVLVVTLKNSQAQRFAHMHLVQRPNFPVPLHIYEEKTICISLEEYATFTQFQVSRQTSTS